MTSEIKENLQSATKDAMRARDKQRVGVLRLVASEIKRVEVDDRVDLDDAGVIKVLDKMAKQRRDSHRQFEAGGRQDLADQEAFELTVLAEFMPPQMDAAEIEAAVDTAIKDTGAASMKDMGKVMGSLKAALQGQADMGEVGKLVKARLGS